jgi:hypothetical protein
MNVANFIFQLLHICNRPTLNVPTPLHSPCTPSIDYAHLSTNYENTFGNYTNFSIDYAHNFDDCANIPDDRENTTTDSVDMLNIPFVDFYISKPTLIQLLFFCRLKMKTMFTIESVICFLSSSFFICGFCI